MTSSAAHASRQSHEHGWLAAQPDGAGVRESERVADGRGVVVIEPVGDADGSGDMDGSALVDGLGLLSSARDGVGDADGIGDGDGSGTDPLSCASKRRSDDEAATLCTATVSTFTPTTRLPTKLKSTAVVSAAPSTVAVANDALVMVPGPKLDLATSTPFRNTNAPSSRMSDSTSDVNAVLAVNFSRAYTTTLFTPVLVFSSPLPKPIGVKPDFHAVDSTYVVVDHAAGTSTVESQYSHVEPNGTSTSADARLITAYSTNATAAPPAEGLARVSAAAWHLTWNRRSCDPRGRAASTALGQPAPHPHRSSDVISLACVSKQSRADLGQTQAARR
jgi:hypothetical protein